MEVNNNGYNEVCSVEEGNADDNMNEEIEVIDEMDPVTTLTTVL